VRIGLSWAIATLVILCILTFGSAVGVNGWETIVYSSAGQTSDSPLPLALAQVAGNSGWMYHLLVSIGLLGLVASFHGIILAAGRVTFEFGRVGYAPKSLG
jgi:ethanolamine permease